MAGAGYKLFATGDVLTAAQVNTYLQEQTVMVFANAAARTTALSGVLTEGMVTYLKDTDALEIYSGSAWVGYGSGDITGITTGATSGLTGGVTSGTADLKLNTTAKGGLLVGTGSGTSTELSVGSNNTVLTADSSTASGLKWAAAGSSGALTLIQRTTFSGVASQAFDNVFTSTYTNYFITFENISAVAATDDFYFQYRYAGPTTQAATYYMSNYYVPDPGATGLNFMGASNSNQFLLSLNTGDSTYKTYGYAYTSGVGNASERTLFIGSLYSNYSDDFNTFAGDQRTQRTYTGFIVSTSSSNISGTVAVYGIAKA